MEDLKTDAIKRCIIGASKNSYVNGDTQDRAAEQLNALIEDNKRMREGIGEIQKYDCEYIIGWLLEAIKPWDDMAKNLHDFAEKIHRRLESLISKQGE